MRGSEAAVEIDPPTAETENSTVDHRADMSLDAALAGDKGKGPFRKE
jgi:hypothetical protein